MDILFFNEKEYEGIKDGYHNEIPLPDFKDLSKKLEEYRASSNSDSYLNREEYYPTWMNKVIQWSLPSGEWRIDYASMHITYNGEFNTTEILNRLNNLAQFLETREIGYLEFGYDSEYTFTIEICDENSVSDDDFVTFFKIIKDIDSLDDLIELLATSPIEEDEEKEDNFTIEKWCDKLQGLGIIAKNQYWKAEEDHIYYLDAFTDYTRLKKLALLAEKIVENNIGSLTISLSSEHSMSIHAIYGLDHLWNFVKKIESL